jgi:prepilin-type N-terminal cleavage/methylation domain-containing protein
MVVFYIFEGNIMQSSKQKGFTLVEIAIVLVIIGLLLGGVLKGQELIDSGKSRQVVNDFNSITAAYYSYQDRYRAVPGDDRTPHGFTNAAPAAGAANGILAGNAFTSAVGSETGLFWGHLRNAGFVKGALTTTAIAQSNPVNAFNAQFGAQTSTGVLLVGGQAIPSPNIMCASVPTKAAQAIDSNLDDGLPNAGSVRGANTAAINTAPAAAPAAIYDNAQNFYTVCKSL